MKWETGQKLPETAKPTITREQLKEYAVASGDHNPIHLDDTFARDAGFDSVIVHGMISMAFLGDHILTTFPAAAFRLTRFKARFRKVTFPGDTLTCGGEIRRAEADGTLVVSLRVKNQREEVTTDGEATLTPV